MLGAEGREPTVTAEDSDTHSRLPVVLKGGGVGVQVRRGSGHLRRTPLHVDPVPSGSLGKDFRVKVRWGRARRRDDGGDFQGLPRPGKSVFPVAAVVSGPYLRVWSDEILEGVSHTLTSEAGGVRPQLCVQALSWRTPSRRVDVSIRSRSSRGLADRPPTTRCSGRRASATERRKKARKKSKERSWETRRPLSRPRRRSGPDSCRSGTFSSLCNPKPLPPIGLCPRDGPRRARVGVESSPVFETGVRDPDRGRLW